MIELPEPKNVDHSITNCIKNRRSIRSYKSTDLTEAQLSNLLWATQGITDKKRNFRSAPSAGATFPLFVYIAKKDGLYKYLPDSHSIEQLSKRDLRESITEAALYQAFIAEAPVVFIIGAEYGRTTDRYGNRGIKYVHIEVGHAAENLHLMAVGLGLGSVPVGAFNDEELKKILNIEHTPLYIIPVGYPR